MLKSNKYSFTFIDLFAGIGGFHLAMHKNGGKCVFASEIDKNARITYRLNFESISPTIFEDGFFNEDITDSNLDYKNIPDFDILCAGFPCQAFSIAGRREGFLDARGTLFFNIEKIIEAKQPKVIFLENVKNLKTHDNKRTFQIMKDILDKKLNYEVHTEVLNAMDYGNIPQNRERIYMVGFHREKVKNYSSFEFPKKVKLSKKIRNLIIQKKQPDYYYYKEAHQYFDELRKTMVSPKTLYQWRRVYVRENKNNVCPTLTANMGTGGHNVPLLIDNYGIRKLTPEECLKFQGFPYTFAFPKGMANSHKYKQAGNSVVVPVVYRITQQILNVLFN
jgi:DNA (cytosine-5)-methyltransferase 1